MNPKHLFKLARPYQWTKNVFVFAGLLFGHGWDKPELIVSSLMAFFAFCLVSSGVYVLNDMADREADRQHPEKCQRPLASGAVTMPVAVVFLGILWGIGFTLGSLVSLSLVTIFAVYSVVNVAYSLRLKHEPVLDVFLLASGFVLRILAGTLGIGIWPSKWLLLTGTAISLFLGFTKRRAELLRLGKDPQRARKVLMFYDEKMLDAAIVITATVTILGYSLYTINKKTVLIHGTEHLMFTVPLVMYGIMRYLFLLYSKRGGGDPSRDLVRDLHILATGVLWVALTLYLIAG
jgi:4-hydroxybenzoate polyprenyltransferase